jgi:hypothetical protein
MKPSRRFGAWTTLMVCGLALAGCQAMGSSAQNNSNCGNAPPTMRSAQENHGSANSNDASYWNDTRYIGNGSFGQPPPP